MNKAMLIALACVGSAAMVAGIAMGETVSSGGRPFTVTMTGAAERPGPGDPDGRGVAKITLNHGQRRVCFEMSVSNVDNITAAHIHRAPPTDPGPIVVGLFMGAFDDQGCINDVNRDLIKEIIQHPERFYVNVHSTANPAGAIRAQLAKK